MTLILAMGCKEGIVLAADGQKTNSYKVGGSDIYTRSETQKIQEFGKNKLWAGAGKEGDIIEFGNRIEALPDNVKEESLTRLDSELNRSLKEIAVAIGDRDSNVLSYIIAGPQAIWHWSNEKQTPDSKTPNEPITYDKNFFATRSPCACAGNSAVALSVQIIVHRYLDRRHVPGQGILHYPRQYTLEQGVVVIYGAMTEAIELCAFGIGLPIDVRVIRNDGAREVFDHEKLEACYSDLMEADYQLFKEVVRRHFN
jgi:20S proteasome alpha/beta subunit